ncbi:MAG: HAD family hydrolase [Myxococcota bacterium]
MTHRAVFFDFGGTLFAYGAIREHFDTLLEDLARRHGVEADRDELRRVYRTTMAGSFAEFQSRPFYLHRDLFAHAHRSFLEDLGVEGAEDAGDLFYSAQSELGMARVTLRPDARPTLEGLRERGLHLGIVSNIDDDQFGPLFSHLGLASLFDATTTSEEARSCKPDPGIFRLALAKTGEVRPEEVVFVGDSPLHDVAGAAALGMTTVLLTRSPQNIGPRPDHTIGSLGELLEIVRT